MLNQIYTQYIINFEKNDDIMDSLALFQEKLQPFLIGKRIQSLVYQITFLYPRMRLELLLFLQMDIPVWKLAFRRFA